MALSFCILVIGLGVEGLEVVRDPRMVGVKGSWGSRSGVVGDL